MSDSTVHLAERSMKARVEYVIRNGIKAGMSAENIAMLVFAAMREPTEEMIAGADFMHPQLRAQAIEDWHALIDAALAEKAT
jgi:hypothetical protein